MKLNDKNMNPIEFFNILTDDPESKIENDLLEMGFLADKFSNLISNYKHENSFTIGINAKWGTGKSTFINFIKQLLIEKNSIEYWFENKYKNSRIFDAIKFINRKIFTPVFKIKDSIKNLAINAIKLGFEGMIFVLNIGFIYLIFKYFDLNQFVPTIIKDNYSDLVFNYLTWFFKIVLIGIVVALPIKDFSLKLLSPYKYSLKHFNLLLEKFEGFIKQILKIEKIIFIDFNPWMYDSQLNLVNNFIEIIRKECNIPHKTRLSSLLDNYKKSLIKQPQYFLVSLVETIFDEPTNEIEQIKSEINSILETANAKIIITIDDIDRLDKQEIATVFKLVKNIANFKNIIYLLPFDKKLVGQLLNNDFNNRGEEYIEKIINFNFDLLPVVNENIYRNILINYLQTFTEKAKESRLPSEEQTEDLKKTMFESFKSSYYEYYGYLFGELFTHIRHIKRYINMVEFCYIPDEMDVYDFLNITAIQYFYPEVYKLMYENKKFLCKHFSLMDDFRKTRRELFYFANELIDQITPKNNNDKVIHINISLSKQMTISESISGLKLNLKNTSNEIIDKIPNLKEKLEFIENNIGKHLDYINYLISQKNISLIKEEIEKFKDHVERETDSIIEELKKYYEIDLYKEEFLNFIKKWSLPEEKQERIIGFLINIFPNLNVLFDFKYRLTNERLYLIRHEEDSLRDRKICNLKFFDNYFKYSLSIDRPSSAEMDNIFNLTLYKTNPQKYETIFRKLEKFKENNSYAKFCNLIEDALIKETSSFLGAGGDAFYDPFKQYIKGLILIFTLNPESYSDFERKYEITYNHRKNIKEGIIKLINYIKNPSISKKLFIDSIQELIDIPEIDKNISAIESLVMFISAIENEYINKTNIEKQDVEILKQNIIARIKKIISDKKIMDYKNLPKFLINTMEYNSELINESLINELMGILISHNNERTNFITIFNRGQHIFYDVDGAFWECYPAIQRWKRREEEQLLV